MSILKMQKKSYAWALIAFTSFYSIGLTAQAAGIGNIFGVLMGKSGAIESETRVDNVLANASAQMNEKLPMIVDRDTRLDKVSTDSGRHFIYHYTLVSVQSSDFDADAFHRIVRPQLKERLCNSAEMKNFLKNGVTISYLYSSMDGHPVGDAKFTPRECGYKGQSKNLRP